MDEFDGVADDAGGDPKSAVDSVNVTHGGESHGSPAERRGVWLRVIGGLIVVVLVDLWAISSLEWVARLALTGPYQIILFLLIPFALLVGWFAAQIGGAAAYTALGKGSSLRRILVGTLATMLLGSGTVFAVRVLTRRALNSEDAGFVLVLVALLFYFLLQVPFWILRFYRGWVICDPWELRTRTDFTPNFSLLHMFGWSTFVALPLVLFRVLVEPGEMLTVILFGGIAWLFCSAHAVGYLYFTMSGSARGGIVVLVRQLMRIGLFSFAFLLLELLVARWLVPRTPSRELCVPLIAAHLIATLASFGWWRWLQRWGFWLRRPLASGNPLRMGSGLDF